MDISLTALEGDIMALFNCSRHTAKEIYYNYAYSEEITELWQIINEEKENNKGE